MRGVRIGAFALAAVLACFAISRFLSVEPAAESTSGTDNGSEMGGFGSAPTSTPPTVPPPPPLPGTNAVQPVKKRQLPTKSAHDEIVPGPPRLSPPAPRQVQTQTQAQIQGQTDAEPKPMIWRGEKDAADSQPRVAPPVPTETASIEEPKGPVIVVPRERPKEDSRGKRWLKAVGKALGIGVKPSPEDEAFR